jgi:hypothetical protein
LFGVCLYILQATTVNFVVFAWIIFHGLNLIPWMVALVQIFFVCFNSIFYPFSFVHLIQNKINCLRKSKWNKNEQLARNCCHLTFEIISKFRKPMRKQDEFKSTSAGHVLQKLLSNDFTVIICKQDYDRHLNISHY